MLSWLMSRRRVGAIVVGSAFLWVCSVSNAQLSTYTANGSGWTSLDQGITQTDFLMTQTATPKGGIKVEGGGAQEIRDPGSSAIVAVSAGGSGLALAEPGSLAAAAHGYASVAGPGTLGGHVMGGFSASSTEYIPITHPTLPVGSMVDFTSSYHLSGFTSSEIPNTGPYKYSGFPYSTGTFFFMFTAYTVNRDTLAYNGDVVGSGTYSFPNGFITAIPDLDFGQTFPMTGKVGDYLVLITSLGLGVQDRAYDGYGQFQESHLDFSHTINLYADAVTPGTQFVGNGHNYTSISEPAGATMFSLAAGMCLMARRRHPRNVGASWARSW